jgi:hypothetical protein
VQTLHSEVQGLHLLAGRTSGKNRDRQQILFDFAVFVFQTLPASSLQPSFGSSSLQEGEKMKEKLRASLLAGGFLVLVSLPVTVLAGGHGAAGGHGVAGGGGQRLHTQAHNSASNHFQMRQRLSDGSHADRAKFGNDAMEKKGNANGPGDGSGPNHPMGDSGYGIHTNR